MSSVTKLTRLVRTTAFKLSLVYLLLSTLVAGALLGAVAFETNRILQQQIDASIATDVATLRGIFDSEGIVALVRAVERSANQPGSNLYLVTSPLGDPVVGNVLSIEPGVIREAGTREIAYARHDDDGDTRRALVRVLVLRGGFRLLIGRDLEERSRLNQVLTRAAGLAAAAVLILGLGGGWLVASRVARRIDAINDTSRSIMAGDLTRRLPHAAAGDEFDRLAESVNAMLARIEELMRGLREVSDNIAHDLKTPLTRLRSRAETALRGAQGPAELREALQGIVEDTDGLIRTFDALLMIARAESGTAVETFTSVDLREVAASVAELYEALAEEKHLAIAVEAPDPVTVRGHRDLLAQALANLVDNAVKHADASPAPNGEASIRIEVRAAERGAAVVVADRGPGIPGSDRERVLERFVRLEASRSRPGAGLGLSLVSAIARLHGGQLRLEDNAPGLRAVLTLGVEPVPAGIGEATSLTASPEVSADRSP
jgi:signal transduction histidine kinase